jgi:hypothetical protein
VCLLLLLLLLSMLVLLGWRAMLWFAGMGVQRLTLSHLEFLKRQAEKNR